MNKGYSYSTTKKAYQLLKMFFEYLEMEDMIDKNPMRTVKLMKKDNYLSAQGKEVKAKCEEVTTFTPEEIELLRQKHSGVTATEKESISRQRRTS